jgi:hypothetical protein
MTDREATCGDAMAASLACPHYIYKDGRPMCDDQRACLHKLINGRSVDKIGGSSV